MKEVALFLKNTSVISVYIPLITGVVVFILTSMYSHWRERRMIRKKSDTFFTIFDAKRNYNSLKNNAEFPGINTLLLHEEHKKINEISEDDKDFLFRFGILQNNGENTVYDVLIILHLLYEDGTKTKKYFELNKVEAKETIYIPLGSLEDPLSVQTEKVRYAYTTTAGEIFWITAFQFKRVFKNVFFRYKLKKIFLFIYLPISMRAISTKYKHDYIIMENK